MFRDSDHHPAPTLRAELLQDMRLLILSSVAVAAATAGFVNWANSHGDPASPEKAPALVFVQD